MVNYYLHISRGYGLDLIDMRAEMIVNVEASINVNIIVFLLGGCRCGRSEG